LKQQKGRYPSEAIFIPGHLLGISKVRKSKESVKKYSPKGKNCADAVEEALKQAGLPLLGKTHYGFNKLAIPE